MVRPISPGEEIDRSRLFDTPVRWGYEYVEPPPPEQSHERSNPPVPQQVRMVPRAQATGQVLAAALATAAGILAIVLDASLGVLSSGGAHGAATTIAILLVHIPAAAVGFWLARTWQRSAARREPSQVTFTVRSNLVAGVNALATFLAPYLVLPIEAVLAWRRIWQRRGDLVPHPGEAKRAEADYLEASSAWQQRISQFEDADLKRFEAVDLWYPVPLSETAQMTCVFGGTPVSWTAVLATLGASLLGSGARILVGDLSRRLTADVLCDLSRTNGISTTEAALPGGAASADLLADIGWNDLSSVLVEVLHSAQQDLDTSRRERQEDRSVIREIAECLDASGPVSIARLRSALLVVQGAAPAENGEAVIAADEHRRLSELFNDVQRQHGMVMERVTRIERSLRDFEVLDGTRREPTGNDNRQQLAGDDDRQEPTGNGNRQDLAGNSDRTALEPPQLVDERHGDLRVIGVDKQTDDLENDRLVDLLFQLLLRRVRQGRVQADVLVILGADRIRREALESLMTHAEQRRIGVLLFFEHLRRDAIGDRRWGWSCSRVPRTWQPSGSQGGE